MNAVAPGLVLTEIMDKDQDRIEKLLAMTGPGRFGFPEEVAQVVVMLAGNGCKNLRYQFSLLISDINGQTINVDGGIYKK